MSDTLGTDLNSTYLTPPQAAKLIPQCTAVTLRRWARQGRVPVVVLPNGRLLFRRSDIVALLRPVTGSAPSSGSATESSGVTEVPGQGALWSASSPEGDSGGGRVE